jgi:tetratricopeptide (TPR) repeat protein
MVIFGGLGNFGVVFKREYLTLATCSLMAWAAAHLPFAILGILLSSSTVLPSIYLLMWALSSLLFGVFMVFALRTVFGTNYGTALLVVSIAWLSFSLGMYVFKYISPWLFSPFLFIFALLYFGGFLKGQVSGLGGAMSDKRNFKRFLHNATVNPNDADARVQLGLIYLKRRQDEKALEYFKEAFEIDNEEIDANYELGKLARKNGELQEALNYFSTVVEQNDKHALSEIWREIGATYLEAGMLKEAEDALETFIERRPYDAEGLYYLGKILKEKGENEKALEKFKETIESVKTAAYYRRGELRKWSKLAQKEI